MPGLTGSQRRSTARSAVVWDALVAVLESQQPGRSATTLDIGGGTGGLAVRIAERGHRVTVIDPSPDALAALSRRADESGVADRVTGQQGDLADVADLVEPGTADLVLCHEVLEIVADPAAALATLAATLRPGGTLSLLVAGRHAAVVARAMAGHFAAARDLLDEAQVEDAGPAHRFTADEITALVAAAGFEVVGVQAVRVFVDLVPSSLVELEPGAEAALVALERAVADRPEYLSLATALHVLARR